MYTDDDLNQAVDNGIFTAPAVEQFRAAMSANRQAPLTNEENFKLISGFNDIFVVMAIGLLLFSSLWALNQFIDTLSLGVFCILSWGLAEFFVLKRKMALPAIALLASFVGGVFAFLSTIFEINLNNENVQPMLLLVIGVTVLASYIHWKRFSVPVTVAACVASVCGFFVALFATYFPEKIEWILQVVFACGILTFIIAMYWDASDRARINYRSDVAFWLHLLSAPLLIHPLFYWLGILEGDDKLNNMLAVLLFYVVITVISLLIDRRVFMISSLIYVLYAIADVLETYGFVGQGIAITGIAIGGALLFLSAFWHYARGLMLKLVPPPLIKYLPSKE